MKWKDLERETAKDAQAAGFRAERISRGDDFRGSFPDAIIHELPHLRIDCKSRTRSWAHWRLYRNSFGAVSMDHPGLLHLIEVTRNIELAVLPWEALLRFGPEMAAKLNFKTVRKYREMAITVLEEVRDLYCTPEVTLKLQRRYGLVPNDRPLIPVVVTKEAGSHGKLACLLWEDFKREFWSGAKV